MAEQISSPAFGTADLSNCEREQIHLAGSIQPHGALLLVRETDGVIVQISENAPAFLGVSGALIGRRLADLGGDLWPRVEPHLADDADAIPVMVRCRIGACDEPFNALLHHPRGGGFVVEIERAGPLVDLSRDLKGAIETIVSASTLQTLCDESARIFRELTGYDRVMVYRFDEAGHGEVFSETKRPELEAFLGNRYPASDIPQIARRLYERNRVRLLADIAFTPAPLTPKLSPLTGEDLDMSLCFLRSSSPIHVQYLKNMGVAATLVVSLMVGGRLWGLVSCHHYAPRLLHFEMRAACELLAEAIGTRIAALESFVQGQGELSVRRLEQRMVESIAREGDWRGALFDSARSLLLPVNATGAALLHEGQILTIGDAPGTAQIRAIGQWIARKPRETVFHTASLGLDEPAFAPLAGVASGVLAARVSGEADEMLIWFRNERVRTVTWGGNPFKPPSPGDDPSELSPRRSFAQWHQVVEGTSDPWTAADLAAARMIGAIVSDVIFQFRTVRILIAQDQLEQMSRQVRRSGQQVVIANAEGRVIETNAAFDALLANGGAGLKHLDELACFFLDHDDVAKKLRGLQENRQAWRGEAQFRSAAGDVKPLLVRAEPVVSPPSRILGYVLVFADLTEKKEAEAARRRFQDSILQSHRKLMGRINSRADLSYENIMSSIIENAQLAALEIADGPDTARMPEMLESVKTSVWRAAEVLEQISSDANDAAPKK